jgi:hypothetical protein
MFSDKKEKLLLLFIFSLTIVHFILSIVDIINVKYNYTVLCDDYKKTLNILLTFAVLGFVATILSLGLTILDKSENIIILTCILSILFYSFHHYYELNEVNETINCDKRKCYSDQVIYHNLLLTINGLIISSLIILIIYKYFD